MFSERHLKGLRNLLQPRSTDPVDRFAETFARAVIPVLLAILIIDLPVNMFYVVTGTGTLDWKNAAGWSLMVAGAIAVILAAAVLLHRGRLKLASQIVVTVMFAASFGATIFDGYQAQIVMPAFMVAILIGAMIGAPRRMILYNVLLVSVLLGVVVAVQMAAAEPHNDMKAFQETYFGVMFTILAVFATEAVILFLFHRQLEQYITAINQARHLAEEASNAKSQLLANVGHELRTPVTVIDACAANLLEGTYPSGKPAPPEQAAMLSAIQRNNVRLLTLIDDLLDYVRLTGSGGAGQVSGSRLHVTETDLSFVDLVLIDLRPSADAKGLALKLVIEPGAPANVVCDVSKIQGILTNLVSNAIKFTSQGSIVVNVGGKAGQWTLSVRDTGIGIAPEHIDKIFDGFYQIESSDSRSYRGVGLGLAIVKALTEVSKGQITVDSEPGKGSTFTVTLPITLSKEVRNEPASN